MCRWDSFLGTGTRDMVCQQFRLQFRFRRFSSLLRHRCSRLLATLLPLALAESLLRRRPRSLLLEFSLMAIPPLLPLCTSATLIPLFILRSCSVTTRLLVSATLLLFSPATMLFLRTLVPVVGLLLMMSVIHVLSLASSPPAWVPSVPMSESAVFRHGRIGAPLLTTRLVTPPVQPMGTVKFMFESEFEQSLTSEPTFISLLPLPMSVLFEPFGPTVVLARTTPVQTAPLPAESTVAE